MTTEPTQTCTTCLRFEMVVLDGRGFPPDIAKRRLAKRCTAAGHPCTPRYQAGIRFMPESMFTREDR